jgi:hypothetical protein
MTACIIVCPALTSKAPHLKRFGGFSIIQKTFAIGRGLQLHAAHEIGLLLSYYGLLRKQKMFATNAQFKTFGPHKTFGRDRGAKSYVQTFLEANTCRSTAKGASGPGHNIFGDLSEKARCKILNILNDVFIISQNFTDLNWNQDCQNSIQM